MSCHALLSEFLLRDTSFLSLSLFVFVVFSVIRPVVVEWSVRLSDVRMTEPGKLVSRLPVLSGSLQSRAHRLITVLQAHAVHGVWPRDAECRSISAACSKETRAPEGIAALSVPPTKKGQTLPPREPRESSVRQCLFGRNRVIFRRGKNRGRSRGRDTGRMYNTRSTVSQCSRIWGALARTPVQKSRC